MMASNGSRELLRGFAQCVTEARERLRLMERQGTAEGKAEPVFREFQLEWKDAIPGANRVVVTVTAFSPEATLAADDRFARECEARERGEQW